MSSQDPLRSYEDIDLRSHIPPHGICDPNEMPPFPISLSRRLQIHNQKRSGKRRSSSRPSSVAPRTQNRVRQPLCRSPSSSTFSQSTWKYMIYFAHAGSRCLPQSREWVPNKKIINNRSASIETMRCSISGETILANFVSETTLPDTLTSRYLVRHWHSLCGHSN